MTQAKASVVNYDCNSSIIVLATVITIVNYNRNSFIIQATTEIMTHLFNRHHSYYNHNIFIVQATGLLTTGLFFSYITCNMIAKLHCNIARVNEALPEALPFSV